MFEEANCTEVINMTMELNSILNEKPSLMTLTPNICVQFVTYPTHLLLLSYQRSCRLSARGAIFVGESPLAIVN